MSEKVRLMILIICLLLLDTGIIITRWALYDEKEEYACFWCEYGGEVSWLQAAKERDLPPQLTVSQEKKLRKISVPETRPQNMGGQKKFSWWYRGNLEHRPVWVDRKLADLLSAYGGIYQGDVNRKGIFLTFDEGYENGFTGHILDVLHKNQVKAAFFITGYYLKKNPDLVKRMVREGHIVGNHTVSHPAMWALTEKELCREVEELAREFKKITDEEMAPFLRPPMGEFSPLSLWVTAKLGYYTVLWSFAYHDWDIKVQRSPQYAYGQVMKNHHPGAVLLLHAVSRDNALALERIIQDLKQEGYEFLSLYELVQD